MVALAPAADIFGAERVVLFLGGTNDDLMMSPAEIPRHRLGVALHTAVQGPTGDLSQRELFQFMLTKTPPPAVAEATHTKRDPALRALTTAAMTDGGNFLFIHDLLGNRDGFGVRPDADGAVRPPPGGHHGRGRSLR